MQKRHSIIIPALIFILSSCGNNNTVIDVADDGEAAFNADSMRQHISVLAADSFMGRKPFTEGETKTLRYLQGAFAASGLEPGNGDSYLQEVPMVNIATTAAPTMEVKTSKGTFTLKGYDDYVLWTDKADSF